ncbi:DUF3085 domain-containing protein [Nocardia cyriacigeorgica]|uniref:Protein of uncharacterized function (DUF3085) n=1 Tax=Nocardia cyriacigeorgica TaxID=135487 RepID=A0A4U8W328_9NOCA|nr:DUF3085 domain-containing protein [Nocardia cyriacigeorgica]VFA96347.1 Protein of uncharacterised function (DUF3085) [Nocardia cyriacigeorgica]
MDRSIELWFPISEVRELAEHAMTATRHQPSFTQADAGRPAAPSLKWVKDDGTYLLSNGRPRLIADPERPDGPSKACYARGWGPGTGPDLASTAVGGDDFVEHLPLDEPVWIDTRTTLIDMIRGVDPATGWMIITAKTSAFDITFADNSQS